MREQTAQVRALVRRAQLLLRMLPEPVSGELDGKGEHER
jgi:hypothetical protein